ncbi:MAG: hypothetical protein QOJ00_2067 [Actinomycetota bacterium]|jgi:hypothetical protein
MIVARVFVAVIAFVVLTRTLMSAIRTFVVPRDEPTALARIVFLTWRKPFLAAAKRRSPEDGHRLMRLFAPLSLLSLPVVWLLVVWVTFAGFFWSFDRMRPLLAFELSGASVTTLGTYRAEHVGSTFLGFVEASLGLGLVALLITYLPTIYSSYQRREREVSLLSVRAGSPPSAVGMLRRFQEVNFLDRTTELWRDWELWFVDIEESHTSMGSLAQFRSGPADHSWITAAGAVLDAASLMLSAVDVEYEPRAALTIRSGFLALRHVSDFYDIPYDPDPAPDDPISITRAEFDDALAQLAQVGTPIKADRDQAWRDFNGWRVNYDAVLLALCALVWAPYAPWSSDRATTFVRPPITRRGGRGSGSRTPSSPAQQK